LSNAQGSASEVDTHFFVSLRLKYLNESEHARLDQQLDDIGRMITGLSNHLRQKAK